MVSHPELLDQPVSLTVYDHPYDNRVLDSNRLYGLSWGEFVESVIEKHEVCDRKDGVRLIAPVRFLAADDPECQHAPYTEEEARRGLGQQDELKLDEHGKPYTWRGAENVASWWMLPVDIDGQQSITQAKAFFSDFAYVAYTSFGHLADGVTEKFRLFLLLKEPVNQEEFAKRRLPMLRWLGAIDTSSLSSSRGFYAPCCPAGRLPLARRWYNEGATCFDVMAFEPPPPKVITPPASLRDGERPALLDLLREQFLGKYEDWWKVSVAMAGAGFSLDDFKYVTVGGMMREKDPRDCEQQWKKALARVRRGGEISVGYLYNLVGKDALQERCEAVRIRALEQDIERLKKIVGEEA